MRGIIISFQSNHGLISGDDGKRYDFINYDWRGSHKAFVGAHVDFIEEGNHAKNIFPLLSNEKYSMLTLALVCCFVGFLGIHRFIVGKTWSGLFMLVLTLSIVGSVVVAIWVIIDFILIVSGHFLNENGDRIAGDNI